MWTNSCSQLEFNFAHFGLAWAEGFARAGLLLNLLLQGSWCCRNVFRNLIFELVNSDRMCKWRDFWAILGSLASFRITKSEFMRGSVRKVQNCTWTGKTTRVSLWGWSQKSSVWTELVGCMAHRDFKVDRLVCCNQGSIHTGIVLNPAGPCAVRHGPYGVLDFRVAIGFPSLCQGCGLGRMLACLFFFRYFWSSATALGQRQFKEDLFLGSYGSESKVHLVRFETSAKNFR